MAASWQRACIPRLAGKRRWHAAPAQSRHLAPRPAQSAKELRNTAVVALNQQQEKGPCALQCSQSHSHQELCLIWGHYHVLYLVSRTVPVSRTVTPAEVGKLRSRQLPKIVQRKLSMQRGNMMTPEDEKGARRSALSLSQKLYMKIGWFPRVLAWERPCHGQVCWRQQAPQAAA